jgi:hypothetical protein
MISISSTNALFLKLLQQCPSTNRRRLDPINAGGTGYEEEAVTVLREIKDISREFEVWTDLLLNSLGAGARLPESDRG